MERQDDLSKLTESGFGMPRISFPTIAALLGMIAIASQAQVAHPDLWPVAKSPLLVDPATEAKIDALLERLSLEQRRNRRSAR